MVTWGPTQNLGPIDAAVLTFIGYIRTDRQAKFIYRYETKELYYLDIPVLCPCLLWYKIYLNNVRACYDTRYTCTMSVLYYLDIPVQCPCLLWYKIYLYNVRACYNTRYTCTMSVLYYLDIPVQCPCLLWYWQRGP